MQQLNILRRLVENDGAKIATEAGDLADIFFSAEDRRGEVSSDRRKVCRAKAKRAIGSLEQRGLVEIYYSLPPNSEVYEAKRMFVEPTSEGERLGRTFLNQSFVSG